MKDKIYNLNGENLKKLFFFEYEKYINRGYNIDQEIIMYLSGEDFFPYELDFDIDPDFGIYEPIKEFIKKIKNEKENDLEDHSSGIYSALKGDYDPGFEAINEGDLCVYLEEEDNQEKAKIITELLLEENNTDNALCDFFNSENYVLYVTNCRFRNERYIIYLSKGNKEELLQHIDNSYKLAGKELKKDIDKIPDFKNNEEVFNFLLKFIKENDVNLKLDNPKLFSFLENKEIRGKFLNDKNTSKKSKKRL